jgi:hypothetical protein
MIKKIVRIVRFGVSAIIVVVGLILALKADVVASFVTQYSPNAVSVVTISAIILVGLGVSGLFEAALPGRCKACRGTGEMVVAWGTDDCLVCGGTGERQ